MKKDKKSFGLLKSLGITLLILIVLMVIRKMYPFGKNGLFYSSDGVLYSYYVKLWDILHGNGLLLYDFKLGLGTDLIHLFTMYGMLSPINLIISLFSKGSITNVLNIIILIKILLINGCSFIGFKKLFPKVKDYLIIIFSLIYTFNGLVFIAGSNNIFLENIALFPLLVLGLVNFIKEGKWKLYSVSLLLSILFNYYLGLISLIFIVIGFLLSLIFIPYEDKKKKTILFFIDTLLVIGISSFILWPLFRYLSISFVPIIEYEKVKWYILFINKIIYILPLGIPAALVIKQLVNKENKKINIYFILLIIISLLSIFIHPLNSLLQKMSVTNYLYELSFIPVFLFNYIALYYLANNKNKTIKSNTINIVFIGLLIILYIVIFGVFNKYNFFGKESLVEGIKEFGQLFELLALFLLSLLITLNILRSYNKYTKWYLLILNVIQVIIMSSSFMFIYNIRYDLGIDEVKELNLDNNYGMLDFDGGFNANYPLLTDVYSLQEYINNPTDDIVSFRDAFGYGGKKQYVYSMGGNLYSNLLIHNKYFYTSTDMNPLLYNNLDNYYESKYNLNYLVSYNGNIFDIDSGSIIDNTNILFNDLFDIKDNVIERVELEDKDDTYTFKALKNREYYIYINPQRYTSISFDFTKNDVNIESIIFGENNLIMINFYTDEDKVINLNKDEYKIETIEVGYIDINKFIDVYNGLKTYKTDIHHSNNKIEYYLNVEDDTNILLPISYNEGLRVKVNKENVKVEKNVLNLTSIKLNKGDNKIEITYRPKYYLVSIITSIISLIMLIGINIIIKKKELKK